MFGKCVSFLVLVCVDLFWRSRIMHVKKLISLASFVLVLGLVVEVQAATVHWTGNGADGLWSTPENWSSGAPPTCPTQKIELVSLQQFT